MSSPVPAPLGRCRNYWADSLRSLEAESRARGLPLSVDGLACNRSDHAVFRALYDLRVPRPLYETTFRLVRPAASLQKRSMIQDAGERFNVKCAGPEKKDVLCAIVRAAADRARLANGARETSTMLTSGAADRTKGGSSTNVLGTTMEGNAVACRTLDNTSTPDNISMETAQSNDQLSNGWAAVCVEAVKADKEAARARDLDASDRKRMVDAVESISNSLRVLAEVAAKMMPDDSDDVDEDEGDF
ncbi:hypothetical protein VSDG_05587 [Cytospora chrysosperma]|uniref:Uncharacterized protein n=1 Tax=Cytospora chrysosperma TaxID=252740 RepID=A0A423W014_CYTCH|nr:hypothetical protein VSDG_05587 [Valsa sordida]